MNKTILLESAKAPVKSQGNRWRVILATPGQGSSGYYSKEVLSKYGPIALAPGAQSFITHNDTRDPRDMIGIFPEGARWDEDEQALVGELDVFPHWKEFVETVGPHSGMSIYMSGEKDADGNVTELFPDSLNGCDLVARPGLAGSGLAEKLYEDARSTYTSKENRKEETMTIEELAAKVDALLPLIEALAADRDEEVVESAQVKADSEAVTAALEAYAAAVEAIEKAELLPSQVADLRARALKGEDVTEAIESAKAIRDELTSEVKESANVGRVLGGKIAESALDLGKVLG